MESIINQSELDISTNNLLYIITSDKDMIKFKEERMNTYYENYLKHHQYSYDQHMIKHGKPPLVYEDNPSYFLESLNIQSLLRFEQVELDKVKLRLAERELEAVGKSWKYIG